MKIGVGVEGPSDRAFWGHVLPKYFRGFGFDIRSMKNRNKLIRSTPDLVEEFKGGGRKAAVIILDLDEDPCVGSVLDQFDEDIRLEARKPVADRYVFILVAIKRLECWYLADAEAVNAILKTGYASPSDTSSCHGTNELKNLLRSVGEESAFNKILFARQISTKFSPDRAKKHSQSFSYSWDRMTGFLKT